MARQIKNIYLCSSLAELQNASKVHSVETTSAKMLLKSVDRLFGEAEKSKLAGDEEKEYLYFFRYIDAVTCAKKKEEYKKDKAYYDRIISPKKTKAAICALEKLTDSLEKRYALKKEIESRDSAAKHKEFHDALENEKNLHKKSTSANAKDGKSLSSGDNVKSSLSSINGIVKSNGVDNKVAVQNGGISPKELKSLLEQKAKRILLVDCRDRVDFTNNHISHSNCICIPATALTKGMSANAVLSTLKEHSPESYMDWQLRDSFDCIILYDWNSNIDNRQPGLGIVYDALTKWDPNCKNTNIQVIQGGMRNVYYMYPNLLTNPQTAVSTANKVNGSAADLSDIKKLEAISYPDIDGISAKPKAPSFEPLTNNDNNVEVPNSVTYESSNDNHHPSPTPSNLADVPKIDGVRTVDRSTKPTGYSSNHKITNGVTNDPSPAAGGSRPSEISSTSDKTDVKVKEYSQALDAVIESTKVAVKSEREIQDLKDMVNKSHNKELESRLKAKELETEDLKKNLELRTGEVSKLKAQYEAVLRDQKAKQYLPRIRTPADEQDITAKEQEKEKLDEYVKELRRNRLQKEKEDERMEELKKADRERNSDNSSKLPPLTHEHAGPSLKVHAGAGTTQLPAISTTTIPGSGSAASVLAKPSSSIPPSSAGSRPVSQDTSGITRQKLKDEGSEPPRSSSLKRSHSHPNIAQSHEEDMGDDLPASSQTPRINRGLKPTSHRANVPEVTTPRRVRNFDAVSSTERSKTGLKNLGNTCYMNSIIQCLSHTSKLVNYLRSEEYLKEWHPRRSPTQGEATEELAAAVKQMHSGHRSISLFDLKSAIGKHHRSFRGYEQQDSHEFITILLDWLHEEMNRAPEQTKLKEQKNDGLTDEIAASRAWDDYKRSNDSKISELFCGQQKSCVTCGSCGRQSVTFEPFFILSVPIPLSGKKCDIQQCIDLYTTEEEVGGWNCVHCKKSVRATKKLDLWRLPHYLIIHLQRFYFDGYWKKRLTEIDFPVDNLSLNHKVMGKETNIIEKCPGNDYQLYGVSNHYGSMDGGHYTAYCRFNGPGNWWKFDDQEVCQINSRDVPTAAAYILFYQNRYY